ncbi:MAG: VOC family protein [Armatimonadota bacterium]
MLVPHFHFNGRCSEAIELYQIAFNTTADVIHYNSEWNLGEEGIGHAEMHIHGQRVMLNDRGGNLDHSTDSAIQMVVIFPNEQELKDSYQILSKASITIDPMQATFYSPCVVGFLDQFGVSWNFMV